MKRSAHSADQFEFDWTRARVARDEGMDRVLGNTPEWWRANCYRLLAERPPEIPVPFIAEDFLLYAEPRIGKPHHPNAWGAVWNAAKRNGLVFPTGEYRSMKKVKSHARLSQLYVWG